MNDFTHYAKQADTLTLRKNDPKFGDMAPIPILNLSYTDLDNNILGFNRSKVWGTTQGAIIAHSFETSIQIDGLIGQTEGYNGNTLDIRHCGKNKDGKQYVSKGISLSYDEAEELYNILKDNLKKIKKKMDP